MMHLASKRFIVGFMFSENTMFLCLHLNFSFVVLLYHFYSSVFIGLNISI